MEKIENILGLVVHNECIMDMFGIELVGFVEWMGKRIGKKLNGEGGVSVAEETVLLERRKNMLDKGEGKAYKEALRLLVRLRPEYKKYLPKRGRRKKVPELSDLLKKRMRLALWIEMGNEIPFRELNVIKVLNLLKAKGYAYRRGELRWYRDNLFVAKDLYGALEHLESLEAVDRIRLTISL